ncbi:MAG: S24/S26 family peptidase [Nitrospiraceae bacterium]
MIRLLCPDPLRTAFSAADLTPVTAAELSHLVEFTVTSWSMLPAIHKGDRVRFEPVETLMVGDIVVFRKEGSLICHRIIAVTDTGMVEVKGDGNQGSGEVMAPSQILGRVCGIARSQDCIPKPSTGNQDRQVDLLVVVLQYWVASVRATTLVACGCLISALKQYGWICRLFSHATKQSVRFSLSRRAPLQSIRGYYRMGGRGHRLHDLLRLIQEHEVVLEALVVQAHLGPYPIAFYHPASGEQHIRRTLHGLGIEECFNVLGQAWPRSTRVHCHQKDHLLSDRQQFSSLR